MSSSDEALRWWLMQRRDVHGSKGNIVVSYWHPRKWRHHWKWCWVDVHGFRWVQVMLVLFVAFFFFLVVSCAVWWFCRHVRGCFWMVNFYGFGKFHSCFVDPICLGDCWCLENVVVKLDRVGCALRYCFFWHYFVASIMFHGGADIPFIEGMSL